MGDRIQVSRSLCWRWFLDDVRTHWRRIHRLYVARAYGWGRR
ncbi:hypothetical protein [Kribbella shirazensis]|uniref:Uncharacterized protein n=1 Tax=Kribbella shirazensis TaxID=1105143 RepID=A0A7X5V8Z4_9ACTN|nr:hypothetical protein [Kribbella shirazensis]NIK56063.1 hypothetical protein [Kribbella shirazensis]